MQNMLLQTMLNFVAATLKCNTWNSRKSDSPEESSLIWDKLPITVVARMYASPGSKRGLLSPFNSQQVTN